MNELTKMHTEVILRLFDDAQHRRMPIWLESGWAIDAHLGQVTRDHEDIDIAYPCERHEEYMQMIKEIGFDSHQTVEYGFLSWAGDILLDSECCRQSDGGYNLEDYPPGSCPMELEGTIAGRAVRCVSWGALYFDFLGYDKEISNEHWRPKDFASLAIIEAHLEPVTRDALRQFHTSVR